MLRAARLPFFALDAKQQKIDRPTKRGAPPMRPLGAFQRVADLFIHPRCAQVFARGIQPDAGRTKFAKGVICQRFEKGRSTTTAGDRQGQTAQFHPTRRMADFAIKRETRSRAWTTLICT